MGSEMCIRDRAMYSEVAIIYLVIFTLLTAAQSALEKYSNRYVRSNNA